MKFDQCSSCKKLIQTESSLTGVLVCKSCFKKSTAKSNRPVSKLITNVCAKERMCYDNYTTLLGEAWHEKSYT